MPLDRRARADLATSLVIIAVGAAAAIGAWRMPRFQNLFEGIYATPGFVPLLVSIVLVVLGVLLLLRSLRGGQPPGRPAPLAGEEEAPSGIVVDEPPAAGTRRFRLALVLCLGYALALVGRLPFWLATTLFVSAFVALFEWGVPRRRGRTVAIALVEGLVVGVAVALVFERLFLVSLP